MSDRTTLGLFAVASVLLGGTFVATKAGLDYFPPLLFVAFRFDIAAVVLAGYALWLTDPGERLPRTRGDVLGILATGLLAIGLANALLFVGQGSTTSGVAAIVFSLNPVLTSVFAGVALADERLSPRGGVGLLLGLLGVGLVVQPDPAMLTGGGAVGKAVIFGGAVAGALGTVAIRWAGGTLSSTVRTAWGLPVAALFTHALSLATGESVAAVTLTTEALLALGYVGVFAGAVAYVAYFGLIDATGASRANLVFYVVPLVATAGGAVLLGESVAPSAVGGFLVVALGFAVLVSESVTLPAGVPTSSQVPGRRRLLRLRDGAVARLPPVITLLRRTAGTDGHTRREGRTRTDGRERGSSGSADSRTRRGFEAD